MRHLFAFIALVLMFSSTSMAQQTRGNINGVIADGGVKTIESATISLHKAVDSSVVKMAVANKEGKYSFDNIPAGRYFIAVTAVGHQKAYSQPITLDQATTNATVPTIEL